MFEITAPAKINLTLEILGRRTDGYHNIRSVIQTVSLADTLRFEPARHLEIASDLPGWQAEESLVSRAAAVLQEYCGQQIGGRVTVIKRIPLASGLGGDSSDAAAMINGLDQLWDLKLSLKIRHNLARKLGSDVPFFLHGGTALMEGRGEIITVLPSFFPGLNLLLLVPDLPRPPHKTKTLYAAMKPAYYTDGQITEKLVNVIRNRQSFSPEYLFNTFENIAFAPNSELKKYRDHVAKIGAGNIHLAGSGPALFTIPESPEKAAELTERISKQNMEILQISTTGEM